VSEFADLDPTPEELADLDEVLDEIELEEAAGLTGDDPDEAPWDGQAAQLADLNATLDAQQGSEHLRQSWDGLPLPRTSEERFAQALGRIAEGSYTPGPMYRSPVPSYGCGTVDDFGRCSARYHQATCMQADHHAAAAGGGESTEAWVGTLLENQAVSDALDEETEALDELDAPGDPDGTWALREQLGLS
jgi:hypothetical protein